MTLIQRAQVAERDKRWNDALDHWTELLQHQPDNVDIASRVGSVLTRLLRFDEAQALFFRIQLKHPDDLRIVIGLINLASAQGDKETELKLMLQAVSRSPQASRAVVTTIHLLMYFNRIDDAKALFDERKNTMQQKDCVAAEIFLASGYGRSKEVISLLDKHADYIKNDQGLRQELLGLTLDIGGAKRAVAMWLGDNPGAKELARAEMILARHDPEIDRDEADETICRLWRTHKWSVFTVEELPTICQAIASREGRGAALSFLADVDRLALKGGTAVRARLLVLFERQALGDPVDLEAQLRRLMQHEDPTRRQTGWRATLDFILGAFHALQSNGTALQMETAWNAASARAVLEHILASYNDRHPLSLIRVGDGEGAFLHYLDEFREFSTIDRESMQRLWWGSPRLDTEDAKFISGALCEAIQNADIIGMMTLEHLCTYLPLAETKSIFPSTQFWRGLISALNHVSSHVSGTYSNKRKNKKIITSLMIPYDFDSHGLFTEMFKTIRCISLVTCHPELELRLAHRFGVEVAETFLVPEETKFSALFQYEPTVESHYPHVFHRLRGELARCGPGTVTLVAAGILGKIYCHWIKGHGGIALDLGSIVDLWCGHRTRGAAWTQRRTVAANPTDLLRAASDRSDDLGLRGETLRLDPGSSVSRGSEANVA